MPIIGLTDKGASFPRIGILRKGGPKVSDRQPGGDLKDHFRLEADNGPVAAAFAAIYGDKPNDIRIMFYGATTADNFEAWQEHWSASSLRHRCDGQTCSLHLTPDGTYSTEPVPCPSLGLSKDQRKLHGCKPAGRLKVVLPDLGMLGYILVTTTSINDIIELQQNLQAAEAMRGDLRGIPFILSRRPRKVSTPDRDGARRRMEKWLLSVEPATDWVQLQLAAMQRAALPGVEPLQLAPPADPMTGEVFDTEDDAPEYKIEDAPAAPAAAPVVPIPRRVPVTSSPVITMALSEAKGRFYVRYVENLGGDEWRHVQAFLPTAAPEPETVEGWIKVGQAMRDSLRRAHERTAGRGMDGWADDYAQVDAAIAATT